MFNQNVPATFRLSSSAPTTVDAMSSRGTSRRIQPRDEAPGKEHLLTS
jgi:hypothetical protein